MKSTALAYGFSNKYGDHNPLHLSVSLFLSFFALYIFVSRVSRFTDSGNLFIGISGDGIYRSRWRCHSSGCYPGRISLLTTVFFFLVEKCFVLSRNCYFDRIIVFSYETTDILTE